MAEQHHVLKTDSPFWADVAAGVKPFEVRNNDRHYHVGDTLCLRDWVPDRGAYRFEIEGTAERVIHAIVGYILYGGWFGVQKGFVVMGLRDVTVGMLHTDELPS